MTEIHLFGSTKSVPADLTCKGLGFIPTPTNHDDLDAYFHKTELGGKVVAIVYSGNNQERDAGPIYDFMDALGAVTPDPFDDPDMALRYFKEERPNLLLVSVELPNLHDFLRGYREVEK